MNVVLVYDGMRLAECDEQATLSCILQLVAYRHQAEHAISSMMMQCSAAY